MKSPWLTVCVFTVVAFLWRTQVTADEPGEAPTPAADPMRGKEAGQIRDDNGLKMKLVWCPPGSITMESVEPINESDSGKYDKPKADKVDSKAPTVTARKPTKTTPVKVVVTTGYWLGKYEVTQSEWKQVMKFEPWKGESYTRNGADFPATFVSWNDAANFCRRLTVQERQANRLPDDWEYTLPTEAQWENACRAETDSRFSFGDDESKIGDYAWFSGNAWKGGEEYAHRVGRKKANPWGLFDTHGNVWEWCRDSYSQTLPGGRDPEVKPEENNRGSPRVVRGGAWDQSASSCRSAFRNVYSPSWRFSYLGFRVALSPSGNK